MGLRGLLWKKLHEKEDKKENSLPEMHKDNKKVELTEEERQVKEEEELIREEEEKIKEEKIKMYRFFDEINKMKLKEMGIDIVDGKIRCVICKKWKGYTDEGLLDLIKRNGIDIIWKYMCDQCRKSMIREKIPEEYVPERVY
jgi:hypothetical protein